MSESSSCIIIAIAGAFCFRKSLIATTIYQPDEIGEGAIGIISEDCYYKDQSHLAMQERIKPIMITRIL